jgi:hypothetical protein
MTIRASRRGRTVYPFPKRRALIPFQREFTLREFERVKLGVLPDDMGHWLIFLEGQRRQYIYFVRSWSGYCPYRVWVERFNDKYRIVEAWASRDPRQYKSTDPQYDAETLATVIDRVLLRRNEN